MSLAICINTACMESSGAKNSQGTVAHERRAYALRHFIIPAYLASPFVHEVIVTGSFVPGDGYLYLNVPSRAFNCTDALAQRQAAFDASTSDVLVFQHDDHLLEVRDIARLEHMIRSADVIVPARYTRERVQAGERLNNGEPSAASTGYISGHAAIFKRAVLDVCPWQAVPRVHTWDNELTQQVMAAGFRVTFDASVAVYDVEFGGRPWE